MARQRLVKPDLFQHEDLHRAEVVSRLPLRIAYIGLWTQCDRRGCFVWKPGTLKLNVLPFDAVDFEAVLSALESAGFVRSYDVAGKRYGWVPTLTDHQTFNVNEKPNPLIPDPPKDGFRTVPALSPHSASTPGTGTGSSTSAGTASGNPRARALGMTTTDSADSARLLTVTANRAIEERFGPQTNPVVASGGSPVELAQAIQDAGIPVEFAQRSIARQVLTLRKPVRTMNYFRNGIIEDWAAEGARQDAAGSDPVAPLERSRNGGKSDNVLDRLKAMSEGKA
jgi:hypothetical protein